MIFAPYDIAIAERERAGKPIRIAVIGAGNLVRMILPQLVNPRPDGFQLVAIVNRTVSRALELLGQNGIVGRTVDDATQAEDAIRSGRPTLINAIIDEGAGTESGRITALNPTAKKK